MPGTAKIPVFFSKGKYFVSVNIFGQLFVLNSFFFMREFFYNVAFSV